MRLLLGLVLSLSVSSKILAQMYADVQTSAGLFTCELNFEETPRTVANFISLAEGNRQWVDERNGLLSTIKPPQPFYNGIIFHRVVNEEGFKIIQAGSKRGDGTDGPGYEFPDEMDLNLPATYRFDQPYYLAMANSGFNTNGSQFFITGSAIEELEGKHTVFGKVVAGQAVVDDILSAEVNLADRPLVDITIQTITVRRVSKDAQKFNSRSQKLPTLSVPSYKIGDAPNSNTIRYKLRQASRTELLAFVSTDPEKNDWQQLDNRWYTFSPFNLSYYDVSYPQDISITGFRPVIAKYYLKSLPPMTPHGYRLSFQNNEGVYEFTFLVSGGVNYVFTPEGSTNSQVGTIPSNAYQYLPSPHSARVTLVIDQQKIIYLELGFDNKVTSGFQGRCVSQVKNFIIIDPESGFGYFPNDFTEPGGDNGFSMVVGGR